MCRWAARRARRTRLGALAERTMGSHGGGAVPVVPKEHSGLANSGEQLPDEHLLADLGIERRTHPAGATGSQGRCTTRSPRVGLASALRNLLRTPGPCRLAASLGLPARHETVQDRNTHRGRRSSVLPHTPATPWWKRPPRAAPAAPSARSSRRPGGPRPRSRSPGWAGGHPWAPRAGLRAVGFTW